MYIFRWRQTLCNSLDCSSFASRIAFLCPLHKVEEWNVAPKEGVSCRHAWYLRGHKPGLAAVAKRTIPDPAAIRVMIPTALLSHSAAQYQHSTASVITHFCRQMFVTSSAAVFKLGYAYSLGTRMLPTSIKTRDRNRLIFELALILALTKIRPRIEVLACQNQAQSSY
jgi:hypothetical protein